MKLSPHLRSPFLAAFLVAGLAATGAHAAPDQPSSPEKNPPSKAAHPVEISILPIGDTPPLVMKAVAGRFVQQAYKLGDAPPADLVFTGKTPVPVPLALTRAYPVAAKILSGETFELASASSGKDAGPWLSVKVPKNSRKLVILLRPSPTDRWLKPLADMIELNPKNLATPGIHVVNLSGVPLAGLIGKKKVELRPGDNRFAALTDAGGDRVSLRLVSPDANHRFTVVEVNRVMETSTDKVVFAIIRPSHSYPGRHVTVCEFAEAVIVPDKKLGVVAGVELASSR